MTFHSKLDHGVHIYEMIFPFKVTDARDFLRISQFSMFDYLPYKEKSRGPRVPAEKAETSASNTADVRPGGSIGTSYGNSMFNWIFLGWRCTIHLQNSTVC